MTNQEYAETYRDAKVWVKTQNDERELEYGEVLGFETVLNSPNIILRLHGDAWDYYMNTYPFWVHRAVDLVIQAYQYLAITTKRSWDPMSNEQNIMLTDMSLLVLPQSKVKLNSTRYPRKCPSCGEPAYVGVVPVDIDCSSSQCHHSRIR